MAKGKNKETKVPDKIVKYVDKKLKAAERREEELKWFGYGLADTGVYNGAGYIQQNMCLIPQGNTDSTRAGDECILKSIQVRLRIKGPQTAVTPYGGLVRCMIFQLKAPSTTAVPITPSVNNLLLADVVTAVRSAMSFRDIDHMSQYVMLYDKVFSTNAQCTAVGNTNNWVQSHVINVPLKYARKSYNFLRVEQNLTELFGLPS